jgi:hypothetical protein
MTGFVAKSVIAAAKSLLEHYGFDLEERTSEQLLEHWVGTYDPRWIRLAAIESLHQGRYKAVSIEQILALWSRRGQPSYHFDHDFESLICNNQPQNLLETRARAETPREFTHLVSARQPKHNSAISTPAAPAQPAEPPLAPVQPLPVTQPQHSSQNPPQIPPGLFPPLTPIVTPETPASIPDIPETPLPSELSSESLSEVLGEPVVNPPAEPSPPESVEVDLDKVDSELNLDWDSEPGDMGLDTLDSLPSGVIPLESMEDVLVEEALATESTTANLSELDSLVASWDEGAVSELELSGVETPEFEPPESVLELLPVGEWGVANHLSSLDSYPTPPETPASASRSESSDAEWSDEVQGELPEVHESATTNSANTNNADVEQPHSSTSSNPTGRVSSLYVPKKIQITQFQPEPKVSDAYNKLRDIARVWHEHQSLLQEQVFE